MKKLRLIAAFAITLMGAASAQAQSIWTNPITGGNPGQTAGNYTTGQTVGANLTVSGISKGTGITGNVANDRYNAAGWDTGAIDTAGGYFQFTLTPNSGFEIDLASFVYSGQASGSGPTSFAFRSSLDNYATNIGTASTGTTISLAGLANVGAGGITFRLYGWGASGAGGTYSVNDFTFNGTLVAVSAGNNTTITAPASAAFGRVMQNSTKSVNVALTKTGSATTTYTAVANNNGVSVTADGNIAAGSQSETVALNLANNANGTASTGVKAYTVTVDNTIGTTGGANQGSADPNDTVSVSATVVANRDVNASTVNLGKVLVGSTTGSQTSTITTAGDDNNNTRVTVNGTAASSGGVSVAAGSNQLFDGAADSTTRSVAGNFATSGTKNGSVALSVTGEGLASESVGAVTVGYSADVYQAASLSANNGSPLGDGALVTLANADTTDGGQRAAAEIVGRTLTGDSAWSVSGLTVGTVINQNSSANGTASFNSTGKLNGTYTGGLMVNLQHADQTIQGTATNDLGSASWNFTHTVSGISATSGTAELTSGTSLSGFGLTSNTGANTTAELIGGSAGSNTTIAMNFNATSSAVNDADRVSDVVELTGLDGNLFVLQLSYDEIAGESGLQLGWFDGTAWVLASTDNNGNNADGLQLAYSGSFADFQAANGTDLSDYIGAYGVDTAANTVWAVLNHNSEFAVVVPEPSTYALLGLGLGALWMLRRKKAAKV